MTQIIIKNNGKARPVDVKFIPETMLTDIQLSNIGIWFSIFPHKFDYIFNVFIDLPIIYHIRHDFLKIQLRSQIYLIIFIKASLFLVW